MRWLRDNPIFAAILLAVLIGAAASTAWLSQARARCRRINADFNARLATIGQEATRALPRGTPASEVVRYLSQRHYAAMTKDDRIIGTQPSAGGCPPFGCGTNEIILEITVPIDKYGVAGAPRVEAGYTNCM